MICSLAQTTIIECWKNLMPEGVVVSAGELEGDFPPLSINERASVGIATRIRILELEAGRMHARLVLEKMGVCNVDILKNKLTGAPIWPPLVVGSITHSRMANNSHVAAAIANSKKFDLLGIDAEWCEQIHPIMWNQFLTPQELNWINLAPMAGRNKLVCEVWTLKEAAIKAAGKGDMMTWTVSKSSTSETYKLKSYAMNEKIELLGRSTCFQGLGLAVVYRYSNSISL